jgi:hypothetical protein
LFDLQFGIGYISPYYVLGGGLIPLFKGISGTFVSPPLLFDVIYSFDVM